MIADGHTRRKWDRAAARYDFMVAKEALTSAVSRYHSAKLSALVM